MNFIEDLICGEEEALADSLQADETLKDELEELRELS